MLRIGFKTEIVVHANKFTPDLSSDLPRQAPPLVGITLTLPCLMQFIHRAAETGGEHHQVGLAAGYGMGSKKKRLLPERQWRCSFVVVQHGQERLVYLFEALLMPLLTDHALMAL